MPRSSPPRSNPSRRTRWVASDPAQQALVAQVLAAAHGALADPTATGLCSVDTLAAKAGVARSVVQKHFGSIAGVLEAMFDELATRGLLRELPQAFARPDPDAALRAFVAAHGRFWDAERVALRRLKAHAAFDVELAQALSAREAERRSSVALLAKRLAPRAHRGGLDAIEALAALTSFESFDALAGDGRRIADVIPAVEALALAALWQAGPH